jgi:hypothetical protein
MYHGWGENCTYVIGRKARRKDPLGGPGRRSMDNVKKDLGEI